MEAIALPLAIAGTAVSTVGSVIGGIQEGNMLRANARAAQSQAAADEEDIRRRNARVLSEVRARTGASGLLMEGSPLEVLADDAAEAELEAQRRRWQGNVEAEQLRSRARGAMIGGFMNAGASLLTGGSRVAGLLSGGGSTGGVGTRGHELSHAGGRY